MTFIIYVTSLIYISVYILYIHYVLIEYWTRNWVGSFWMGLCYECMHDSGYGSCVLGDLS